LLFIEVVLWFSAKHALKYLKRSSKSFCSKGRWAEALIIFKELGKVAGIFISKAGGNFLIGFIRIE